CTITVLDLFSPRPSTVLFCLVVICSLYAFALFFFFYCVPVSLALHSFPTRRSSDLSFFSFLFSFTNLVLGAFILFFIGNLPYKIDRKSTRLNSSHVSISYAVFCLKKKINVM